MCLLAGISLRYRRQVLALKQFFSTAAVHRAAARRHDIASRADLQVQSIAHGVISLEQAIQPFGTESRRRLASQDAAASRSSGGFHDFHPPTPGCRVFPRLVAAAPSLPVEPDQAPRRAR